RFVPPIIVGENVFWSSARLPSEASKRNDYARKMVKAWMTSENHRKNILNPNFSRIGVGFFNGYVTQLFTSQDPIDLTPES
ncbi:MAG: CAP domain-containing protein, partial [Pseudomonadota bacterium]